MINAIQDYRDRYTNIFEILVMSAFALGLALAGGLLTSKFDLLVIPVSFGLIMIVGILHFGYKIWFWYLCFLLGGYVFASRGFAYIGMYPLYVAEIGIGLGVLSVLLMPFARNFERVPARPFLNATTFFMVLFTIWSVLQTVPYIREYQFDALRDGMLYGYVAYTFLIMLLVPRHRIKQFFLIFERAVPYIIMWAPILFILSRVFILPISWPGANSPIIFTKGSDMGVHLAAAGALLMMEFMPKRGMMSGMMRYVNWSVWMFAVLMYGSVGRGVFLAALGSQGIVALFRPFESRWHRPTLIVVIVACLMLVTGTYSTLEIDMGLNRKISVEQFVANMSSIFGEGDQEQGGLEGTKQWRLRWWSDIVDYTVNGDYFWTGKGYGINLATSDGYHVTKDESLRSPHNGHMTVLARSGVPGFVLWIAMNVSLIVMLLRWAMLERKKYPFESQVAVWMIALFAAYHLVTAVDVFLEGPMGGVWFWALIGFCLKFFYTTEESTPPAAPALPVGNIISIPSPLPQRVGAVAVEDATMPALPAAVGEDYDEDDETQPMRPAAVEDPYVLEAPTRPIRRSLITDEDETLPYFIEEAEEDETVPMADETMRALVEERREARVGAGEQSKSAHNGDHPNTEDETQAEVPHTNGASVKQDADSTKPSRDDIRPYLEGEDENETDEAESQDEPTDLLDKP